MRQLFQANKTLVIATRNRGKAAEFAKLLQPFGIEVKSLNEVPDMPDIVEDGATFADNALIKARTIAERLGEPVLADDSGLCVDALNGAPGVISARYADEHATDAMNNAKLIAELGQRVQPHELPAQAGGETAGGERHPLVLSGAAFVCALALYDPASRETLHVEGECLGFIIGAPRGEAGFGYDPLFYVPELGRTMAELSAEHKNKISHRGEALRKLTAILESGG
ncbi:non-canonical purine NTP pyrophosphatase [Paenibacillus contaminans]|uniref:dITP/XTP pyrophosphatase n=1 Tax=Paenibacillus contaminans TaxID=450362 RepID=A0A329MQ74_9BACL|nr:non-canonical purine NTP pyrophosphatase [Paenibacillus contaminans]RAV22045.1 non-canonical purine NTP pyrophosphatase [Paenibacillus contaminans]